MSNELKFWVSIWAVLSTTILGIVYLTTAYWADHNTKIVSLINDGVDPVSAMCAMQDDYGNNPTCIVLATKRPVQ